jgi:hypothetical protein
MLDHILQCVQAFEYEHSVSPDAVYINPFHYPGLRRYHPELFNTGETFSLGFRLVIIPGNQLTHPRAALLTSGYADSFFFSGQRRWLIAITLLEVVGPVGCCDNIQSDQYSTCQQKTH